MYKKKEKVMREGSAHSRILAVADFCQVHPCDNPKACSQPLQQQPNDGGHKEHP